MKIIIRVKNFDETIKRITAQGILYTTSESDERFISFDECYSNYLRTLKDSPNNDIPSALKYIGQRDILDDPPYIQVFTVPMTRFEFDSVDDWHQLQNEIRKSRWATIDLT
jgi:hypothetical protein